MPAHTHTHLCPPPPQMIDLRCDPEGPGEATTIESSLTHQHGMAVDAIVRWGTLKPGDLVVVGDKVCVG